MSEKIVIRLINRDHVETVMSCKTKLALEVVEAALMKRHNEQVLLPDKISQIFDEVSQDRINCMPATLLDEKVCGVKWVSVFPHNAYIQKHNVTGVMLLSSIETGYPLAMLDATYSTALRTAAIGAVAVKYLSRKNSTIIGLIGSGEQAKMHFRMISLVRPISECYVMSRRKTSEKAFIDELSKDYPQVKFNACDGDSSLATKYADIIVTAISSQKPILKAKDIKQGATYIHVGGWEDEYDVVRKADKIVCDEWESVKHRSQTISRMYQEKLLFDSDIYADLHEIISAQKKGRISENEFIYFNSVGLAFIDVMFAYEIYNSCIERNLGESFCL